MPANPDAAAAVVLSWLLSYAVHSTILLAAAAVAARRLADQHAWLDLIWKTAVFAPLVTASLPLTPIAFSLGGRWAMPTVTIVNRPAIAAPVRMAAPSSNTDFLPATAMARVTWSRRRDRAAESDRATAPGEARATLWQAVLRQWPAIAVATWLCIALAGIARYSVRLRTVYKVLRSGVPVTATDVLDTVEELRRRANQRQTLHLTTNPLCPVPLALCGRHVVLPERFLQELDPDQQRAALAHEMAHVVRRDPEWRLAVEMVERALFFQPLNRLARVRLVGTAEFLCDEWAVRHTASPLALAHCLSIVASWWSPADSLPAGVSAMARSDSAMVRRVTRILDTSARITHRPRLHWLAIPVALVAVAAPRVTATQLPAPVALTTADTGVVRTAKTENAAEQRVAQREWTAADLAAAQSELRLHRFDRPGVPLEERWRQALSDAARQDIGDFWIVYAFHTPTHDGDLVIHDTLDGLSVSSNGHINTRGPSLTRLFNPTTVPLEGGNLAVLLHYRGTRPAAIDRGGYRSAQLGFDFGRTPVFWLGDASESQSFERVRSLFDQTRTTNIQVLLIELASLHSNTEVVAPFLTRLVNPPWPAEIRREAAEGFGHHHDPGSVEILLRVARTDSDSSVRADAAETIGEVQTPQSIPALTALVSESMDLEVRREAAEAFGEQPADRAIAAIERVLETNEHDDVLGEAIEALGELGDPEALPVLVRTVDSHPRRQAQLEAVETLGEIDAPGAVEALTRIAWEHPDVTIQKEAVETLGDRRNDAAAMAALERLAREQDREEVQAEAIATIGEAGEHALHPLLLELAVSGRSARARREALDAIGEAVSKTGDAELLDRAQAVIERAVFDDPDRAVRADALDALDKLPDERARRVLRDIIARHPDPRLRREAEEQLRERQ